MQGFISTWVNLDRRKQSIVIFAVVGVLMSMFLLAKMASKPTMQLLYSGLNPDSAAEIVAFLDQEQVSYEIKGASIYVDSIQKDKLRLVLAGQGYRKIVARGTNCSIRSAGLAQPPRCLMRLIGGQKKVSWRARLWQAHISRVPGCI